MEEPSKIFTRFFLTRNRVGVQFRNVGNSTSNKRDISFIAPTFFAMKFIAIYLAEDIDPKQETISVNLPFHLILTKKRANPNDLRKPTMRKRRFKLWNQRRKAPYY